MSKHRYSDPPETTRRPLLASASIPRPTFIPDGLHLVTLLCRSDPRQDRELLDRLRGHYHGKPRVKKRHWRPGWRYWGPGWFFYIKSPDAYALELLAEETDWRIVGLEIARDFIFNTQAEADAMKLALVRHLVMTHPGKHLKRSYLNTDYWGQLRRGRATNFPVCYSDWRSHLTRQRNCCHLEWRFHGSEAVRRHLDIYSPRDLIRFDFAGFWRKHLDLRALDLARAGRDQRNHETGRRRRGYHPDDADHGRRLLRVYGGHPRQRGTAWTMQHFIRRRGCGPAVVKLELPRGYSRASMRRPLPRARAAVSPTPTPSTRPHPAAFRASSTSSDQAFQRHEQHPHHPSAQPHPSRAPPEACAGYLYD